MKASINIAIHNEAKLLPKTMPSVYRLKPDEVLWGLDRCTDESRKIIEKEAKKHDADTRIIEYGEDDGVGWNFRRAYLRWDLTYESRNEVIVSSAADIILDPKLNNLLRLIPGKYRIISIGYLDRPWTHQTLLRAIAAESRIFYGFGGVMAFSRSAWWDTEDMESLKKIYIGEDTHLHQAIRGKYPARYMNTKTFHLRPNEGSSQHYRRGVAQWETLHKSYPGAFLHSLLLIRPASFTGYHHARSGRISASQIAYRRELFGGSAP